MTMTLKEKTPLLVPPSVQRRARLKAGDQVEFKTAPGMITIISKPSVVAPATDDEYTPEQRRIIDAQLAEGLDDIRKGRVSRRFDTLDEMLASMKARKKNPPRRKIRSQLAGSRQQGLAVLLQDRKRYLHHGEDHSSPQMSARSSAAKRR
jgi:hypothetical protein